jgi:hypothetical protein
VVWLKHILKLNLKLNMKFQKSDVRIFDSILSLHKLMN